MSSRLASRYTDPGNKSLRGGTSACWKTCGNGTAVDVVTLNDFQATLLHLLGLDYQQLVYHANGREYRLTDGRPARIVQPILA